MSTFLPIYEGENQQLRRSKRLSNPGLGLNLEQDNSKRVLRDISNRQQQLTSSDLASKPKVRTFSLN